jgi:hypothetical protein
MSGDARHCSIIKGERVIIIIIIILLRLLLLLDLHPTVLFLDLGPSQC